MPEREDEDLLISAGQGDREAFGLLVERHHRAVVQFAYRFLGKVDRDTAEDLAQDVFLRAWKSAPSFQPRARVLTWLLRLTTNACLNYQRGRRLRRVISLQPDAPGNDSELPSKPADAASPPDEDTARVRSAVAELPDSQRAAITLRHFHDFSYGEIAEVLETSVSAVESLLFRARKTLRGRLADLRNPAESPQVLPELGAESL
jgi:RNA polymerase sigma-70 factor (ECF subfamily)